MSSHHEDQPPRPVPSWALRVTPGTLDRRVLGQGTFWITVEANVLPLRVMSTEHLRNVQRMLDSYAKHLHFQALLDALTDTVVADLTGTPSAERLAHDLLGHSIADPDAHTWLHGTALRRAIQNELRTRRPGPGR